MPRTLRFGLSSIAGIFVTLALFYLMQALIQGADSALSDDDLGNLIDFVRVKQDQDVETKKRKPKKPPPPDEPPPDVPPQNFNVAVDKAGFSMANVNTNVNINIGSGGFGISDGDYLPIVKVQPQYPRRALSRGMTGWVIVEFTVTELGTVRDAHVVENCGWIQNARKEGQCVDNPNSVFNSSAVKAALKFKYKPKVIDGDPVPTAGVQNKITFELVND
ncbi:MAG: protein TonB [Gammaproteobacteria bacterium]|jgi:protein TonB|nr:protein TonB [Gammaproteobacteria bacterium]|tara:strand:+ start:1689 stop:2345 length:657 start_codon:yes stop_codon:yes gene_type:complete